MKLLETNLDVLNSFIHWKKKVKVNKNDRFILMPKERILLTMLFINNSSIKWQQVFIGVIEFITSRT